MSRFIVYLLILVTLFLSACSPAKADPVNLTAKDAGKSVELKIGQTLVVALEGNPSTGYNWEPENKDLKTLKMTGEPEFQAANQNAVGSPGTITLRFTAVAAGQEPLKLVYHRSWETGVEPSNVFEITVVVK